ncbi:YciI family protein [Fundicoccus culcitae]|uniref:YciI family protein n=1 Tax=Fundicoccus culcitae TaxID=2969821 RepID=A0ABY5P3R9_9LACT|nr:YciI family protein [Fundicoccus culcitae]UUX33377.1 YciI family protein [Fundicoccus culcitae]
MSTNKEQFIYVLKLIPALLNEGNWTELEEQIVGRHFSRLEALLAEGKLVLAGKTQGLDEKSFGIVILEVEDEASAVAIMQSDPAVAEGIMTAELFPYRVALSK